MALHAILKNISLKVFMPVTKSSVEVGGVDLFQQCLAIGARNSKKTQHWFTATVLEKTGEEDIG